MGLASSTAAADPVIGWRRLRGGAARARTTPTVLALATGTIVVVTLVLAGVGLAVAVHHRAATTSILDDTSALVVDAQSLYVALATADAAATTTFLEAGFEPPALRRRYDDAITEAGRMVAALAAREARAPATSAAVAEIAVALPRYAGLVESARANNRLDFPVGAAYLREASALMRATILPAATTVYDGAARQLDEDYRDGTSRVPMAVVLSVATLASALLMTTQVFVARRTRRWLNPALVLATMLVLAVGTVTVVVLASQHASLDRSRDAGADPLLLAATSRILVLRAVSDANLDLVERGTKPEHLADFDVVMASLGAGDAAPGHIHRTVELAAAAGSASTSTVLTAFDDYLGAHEEVRRTAADASYEEAVEVAVGEEAAAAARLDEALGVEVTSAHTRLVTSAADARAALSPLPAVAVLAAAVAAALTFAGVRPRVREYR